MDNSDFVAINIKNPTSPKTKLLCRRCNCNLVLIDMKSDEWWCQSCRISYFPNRQVVKKANRFETPRGSDPDSTNKVPLVSLVNDNPQPAITGKLPPSIKALKERTGVNITSFHSTVDDESL